jgi:hypothetical protein
MPWEGRGTGVITPEACVTVCLAVLEVIPDKVERTRRGTSCQVAGGLKSEPAAATLRPHRTTAKPRKQGRKLYPHPPAEYAPATHRNAGVAGGAQINQSGPSPSGSDMSRHPRR